MLEHLVREAVVLELVTNNRRTNTSHFTRFITWRTEREKREKCYPFASMAYCVCGATEML